MTTIQPSRPTSVHLPDQEIRIWTRPGAPLDGYVKADKIGPIARDPNPLPLPTSKTLGKPRKRGFFGRALSGIGSFFSRAGEAVSTVVTGAVDTVGKSVVNVVEGLDRAGSALGMIVSGRVGKGLGELGLALLDTTLGTAADALLFLGAKGISAIQTLTFLEPRGRKLTGAEIETLRTVYGDSIDYGKIRIKEGFAGIASLNSRPFTLGNTIYVKDFAAADDLLVHEVAHVWQFQNGGTDYMRESLVSQVNGHGYDWQSSVPETAWSELEPEQQAELLEDAFQADYFDTGTFVAYIDDGAIDLTAYMESALAELRAGNGAP